MAKLRRYLEGHEFNSHKDVRKKNYPMVVMMRGDLPDWAKKCLHILAQQIDSRFLKRKMSKRIYIATVMDPRKKLDKCFRPVVMPCLLLMPRSCTYLNWRTSHAVMTSRSSRRPMLFRLLHHVPVVVTASPEFVLT
jgi:hypothetical protein